jgi:pyruvate/2-oxoglutarate dehydrogenase complex dihydrolipoamide acyltransferase (E2) component
VALGVNAFKAGVLIEALNKPDEYVTVGLLIAVLAVSAPSKPLN